MLIMQCSELDEWCCCLSAQCDPVVGIEQKINLLMEVMSNCEALHLHWLYCPVPKAGTFFKAEFIQFWTQLLAEVSS